MVQAGVRPRVSVEQTGFRSRLHSVSTVVQTKVAFTGLDNKRHTRDWINTYAHGHWRNLNKEL
jgi:hypothetical protein